MCKTAAQVSDFVVEIITASPTPIPTPILDEESDGVVQLSVVGEDCVGEDCSGSQEETEAKKPTIAEQVWKEITSPVAIILAGLGTAGAFFRQKLRLAAERALIALRSTRTQKVRQEAVAKLTKGTGVN